MKKQRYDEDTEKRAGIELIKKPSSFSFSL
jgi:hypothetical protein